MSAVPMDTKEGVGSPTGVTDGDDCVGMGTKLMSCSQGSSLLAISSSDEALDILC